MFHRFSQYKSYQTILIMTLCGITHGSACGKIRFQWFSLSLCFNAVLVFKYKFSENHFKVINSTANNALHAYMLLHWLHHCRTNTASFRHINHVRHQKKHCSTTAINSKHHPLPSQHRDTFQALSFPPWCLNDLTLHPVTLRMTTILCFFSLAFKPLLSPFSLHVFSPYPLSFISIGEHRLACLSPSVLTNISLHAASFHSSILSSTRALLLSPYH